MLVGKGIFGWDRADRRTRRYGGVQLHTTNYAQSVTVDAQVHQEAIHNLQGRVRLYGKVIESRVSGHVGDLFLRIKPTQPEVGEIVELGVGQIVLEASSYSPLPCILLTPEDGRREFWMDPHKLYRLHDQTVELYAEETDLPCHEAPYFETATAGMKAVGGGTFQVSGVDPEEIAKICPKIQKIPGMEHAFTLTSVFEEGEVVEYTRKDGP